MNLPLIHLLLPIFSFFGKFLSKKEERVIIFENVDYLKTKGLSLYILWRSRNLGDGSSAKRYSDHFVLIQNTKIWHKGGFNENDAE